MPRLGVIGCGRVVVEDPVLVQAVVQRVRAQQRQTHAPVGGGFGPGADLVAEREPSA